MTGLVTCNWHRRPLSRQLLSPVWSGQLTISSPGVHCTAVHWTQTDWSGNILRSARLCLCETTNPAVYHVKRREGRNEYSVKIGSCKSIMLVVDRIGSAQSTSCLTPKIWNLTKLPQLAGMTICCLAFMALIKSITHQVLDKIHLMKNEAWSLNQYI